MNIETLQPVDSRKSFYGKAHVIAVQEGGATTYYLRSYETIVASVRCGVLYRHWSGWSATTGRHVNAFARTYAGFSIGKAGWDKIPVTIYMDDLHDAM